MATTFTWSINEMETYPKIDNLDNFVAFVEWQLTGDDGKNTSFTKAVFGYKPQDVTGFTPYNELTQEQVLGWVKDRLGAEGVAHFESVVQQQLDSMDIKVDPAIPQPLPWA
jgi:hypothetical protein